MLGGGHMDVCVVGIIGLNVSRKETGWPGLRGGSIGGYNLHIPIRLWRTNHMWAVSFGA